MNTKAYRRDCVFGALGALFMLAGGLCLSIVPASEGDSGLFAREAYLNGGFQSWRLPLLLATGLIGMALGFFTVRAFYSQIDENSRKPAWHFSSEALSMSRQPECFTFS